MNYRRHLSRYTVLIILAICSSALAAVAHPKAAPASPATTANAIAALPSEATAEAFLKQMFGWNQDLTWKVADIKPAEAPGFAEVTAVFNTPQGQQIFRLFVTPDQIGRSTRLNSSHLGIS